LCGKKIEKVLLRHKADSRLNHGQMGAIDEVYVAVIINNVQLLHLLMRYL